MAISLKSDGSFSIEYEGPYQGIDTQHPETLISDKATFLMQNFMLRNSELRSRPQFVLHSTVNTPFGGPIQGVSFFVDINGVFHTVVWSQNQILQYRSATNDWIAIPPNTVNANGNPIMAYRSFANKIYYTNKINPFVLYSFTVAPFMGFWDGLSANAVVSQTFADASVSNSAAGISKADSPTVGGGLPGGPTIVGPISIGAQFIGELDNHLILANVGIQDQGGGPSGTFYDFPNLMWWSANGLPLQWDPTQNTSAGFNPFLDVPDQITGLATLGIAGYLFRTSGITQFTPTGSAVTPFEFDHMWASNHGIGNVFPWSVSQYGPKCAFIAEDNIYALSVTNAEPIGGAARDAIFADIAASTGLTSTIPPSGTAFAAIVPKFKNGIVYLTYQIALAIPSAGSFFVRFWIYSFEDKNWSLWDTTQVQLACPMNTV